MKRGGSHEWARRVAPDLLAACEAEARDRARRIVVRRLTRRLVRALEARAGAAGVGSAALPDPLAESGTVVVAAPEAPSVVAAPQAPPVPEASSDGQLALCLHAVTWARPLVLDALPGLDGRGAPRVISESGLAAVVSEVGTDLFQGLDVEPALEGSRLSLLAERHDAIVFAVARQGTALPARFGTVLTDAAAVESLLAGRHHELVCDLERLARRWEWRCRLLCDGDALRAAIAAPARLDPPQELGEGAAYLAERSEARRLVEVGRRELAEARARVVAAVRAVAADLVPTASADERAVFSAALLVDEEAQDRLGQVVDGLNAEISQLGLRVDVAGPLPLYHFAETAPGLRSA